MRQIQYATLTLYALTSWGCTQQQPAITLESLGSAQEETAIGGVWVERYPNALSPAGEDRKCLLTPLQKIFNREGRVTQVVGFSDGNCFDLSLFSAVDDPEHGLVRNEQTLWVGQARATRASFRWHQTQSPEIGEPVTMIAHFGAQGAAPEVLRFPANPACTQSIAQLDGENVEISILRDTAVTIEAPKDNREKFSVKFSVPVRVPSDFDVAMLAGAPIYFDNAGSPCVVGSLAQLNIKDGFATSASANALHARSDSRFWNRVYNTNPDSIVKEIALKDRACGAVILDTSEELTERQHETHQIWAQTARHCAEDDLQQTPWVFLAEKRPQHATIRTTSTYVPCPGELETCGQTLEQATASDVLQIDATFDAAVDQFVRELGTNPISAATPCPGPLAGYKGRTVHVLGPDNSNLRVGGMTVLDIQDNGRVIKLAPPAGRIYLSIEPFGFSGGAIVDETTGCVLGSMSNWSLESGETTSAAGTKIRPARSSDWDVSVQLQTERE